MSLSDFIDKSSGYIPLWRDGWEDWDWYYDDNTKNVFIHCYRRAGYRDRSYQGVRLKKGSFVTSRSQIARELKISEQNVRTALKKLVSTNDILVETSRKGTIITVKNYDYLVNTKLTVNQHLTNSQPTPNQPLTSNQPTANQQLTTNNKEKKEKNVVTQNSVTNYTDDFLEFWEAYKKKRDKMSTFEYWQTMDVNDGLLKDIIKGAEEYSKTFQGNSTYMKYPRTFLIDEMWKEFIEESRNEENEVLKEKEKNLEYFKKMGVVDDEGNIL